MQHDAELQRDTTWNLLVVLVEEKSFHCNIKKNQNPEKLWLNNQAQVWLISTKAGNQHTGEPHEANQCSKKPELESSALDK